MDNVPEPSKILVVDDNPHNLYSFQAILRGPEVEVLTAASGTEALETLLDHPDVAVIVMDVQMPGMDGFETAELIRGYPKFRDIPILFITAVYHSDEFARRGFRAGASDYITKPVDNEILVSKVKVFLTLQRQKGQLVREIEARSVAETQVRHLNMVLRAIRNVNQLIVREKDATLLVQHACDCLIETRGFQSAWIALLGGELEGSQVVEAGLRQDFAGVAELLAGGELPACGEQALGDGGTGAWMVAAEGCASCGVAGACSPRPSLVARLVHGSRVYGVLGVSFPPGIEGNDEEQGLLAELAADLAYALHSIEQEEARRKAEEALMQAERLSAMGRMAASLAHEINNPLQAVLGSLELARELIEDGEETDRFMDVAVGELRRAAGITKQMRDLGQQRDEQKQLFDVGELLETVLTLTHNRARVQRVEVILEGAEGVRPIPVVPDRVQQVFLNVVLNAIDAMPEGGELRIRVGETVEPQGLEVTFTDTGVGIPSGDLEQVFEPFHSTKELGLGLGLYISRNIVHDHRGWIEVRSEEGKGTTLTVWLPGEEDDAVRQPSPN